jgi:hypothetical protein
MKEGKRLQALPLLFFSQGFFPHYLGDFPNTILQAVLLACEFAKNGE